MKYRFPFDGLYELSTRGDAFATFDFAAAELEGLMATRAWDQLNGFINELDLGRLQSDEALSLMMFLSPVKAQLPVWQTWTQMVRLRVGADVADQATIDHAMMYYE